MKKIIVFIALCIVTLATNAQDCRSNMDKYWYYRQRLRDNFMVVSPDVDMFGNNLPASVRELDVNGNIKAIHWDDNNANLPHYLCVLATEYRLLKNNGQDYSETLKELLYVMYAIERRDLYSEYILRSYLNKPIYCYPINGMTYCEYFDHNNDLNGFYIRDDVTDGFWSENYDHFGFTDYDIDNQLFSTGYLNLNYPPSHPWESMSQDNVYHLLEGLALIAKLVDNEDVSNIPITLPDPSYIMDYLSSKGIYNGNVVNFSAWAKDIVRRSIRVMQHHDGALLIYLWEIPVQGTLWFLFNYIRDALVEQGSGSDFDLAYIYNYGVSEAGNKITGEYFHFDSSQNNAGNFKMLFGNNEATFFGFTLCTWDAYKVSTLGTIADVDSVNTYEILRNYTGNIDWDQPYEHFPLIYLILHGSEHIGLNTVGSSEYNTDKSKYFKLLNDAPACGPYKIKDSNGNLTWGSYYWSSPSRLVWPEGIGNKDSTNLGEYAGLDYMMLFNLFYLTFAKKTCDNITISQNYINQTNAVEACSITATNLITGGNVSYTAGKTISLKQGFKAASTSSSLFKASINPNYYISDYMNYGTCSCASGGKKSAARVKHFIPNNSLLRPPTYEKGIKGNTGRYPASNSIDIYPNPASGQFYISSPDAKINKIQITDLSGRNIFSRNCTSSMEEINLNEQKGVYIVKVYLNNSINIKEIVIQ